MKEDILSIIESKSLSSCVYVLCKPHDNYQINKLELENNSVINIQETIVKTIKTKYFNDNQEYLSINQIATENKNAIYTLDNYKDIEGLNFIQFDDSINDPYIHTYGDIISFIIKVSNGDKSIYCFQTVFPVSLIKRNGKIPLFRDGNTF